MQLDQARSRYVMPEDFYRISSACIDDRDIAGALYGLTVVKMADIKQMQETHEKEDSILGRPVYIAVDAGFPAIVEVWPVPDRRYTARIRYEQHEKEI